MYKAHRRRRMYKSAEHKSGASAAECRDLNTTSTTGPAVPWPLKGPRSLCLVSQDARIWDQGAFAFAFALQGRFGLDFGGLACELDWLHRPGCARFLPTLAPCGGPVRHGGGGSVEARRRAWVRHLLPPRRRRRRPALRRLPRAHGLRLAAAVLPPAPAPSSILRRQPRALCPYTMHFFCGLSSEKPMSSARFG